MNVYAFLIFYTENNDTSPSSTKCSLLKAKDDRKKNLLLLSSLQGVALCTNCCINPISFSFSFEQICRTCFTEKYEK